MTESLRMRVVEAGARAAYEADVKRMVDAAAPKMMLLPDWDELPEDDVEAYSRRAGRYLDGFLDCLTENADEWDEAAGVGNAAYGYARDLLAALREPTDG